MRQIAQNQQKLKNYTFIDLFAGIGGFHYALKSFGAKAVFASEIDKKAATAYEQNHGLKPYGDITKIAVELQCNEKVAIMVEKLHKCCNLKSILRNYLMPKFLTQQIKIRKPS